MRFYDFVICVLLIALGFALYPVIFPFDYTSDTELRIEGLEERVEMLEEQTRQQQEIIDSLGELSSLILDDLQEWNHAAMEVTAYAPFDNVSGMCNDGDPNYTATGTTPSWGTVAVNPSVIPYNSLLYIPGYGWGRAEDTGSLIRARDDVIDVFMWTYDEAIEWGRQEVTVFWREMD